MMTSTIRKIQSKRGMWVTGNWITCGWYNLSLLCCYQYALTHRTHRKSSQWIDRIIIGCMSKCFASCSNWWCNATNKEGLLSRTKRIWIMTRNSNLQEWGKNAWKKLYFGLYTYETIRQIWMIGFKSIVQNRNNDPLTSDALFPSRNYVHIEPISTMLLNRKKISF